MSHINLKYLIIIIAVILIILSALIWVNTENKKAQNSKPCPEIKAFQTVIIKDGSFEPDAIKVQKCTKVTFKNVDNKAHWPASNLHPTHGIYPEFDPQMGIQPDKEWQFIFDKVGIWRYHDHLYPSVKGEIQVNE